MNEEGVAHGMGGQTPPLRCPDHLTTLLTLTGFLPAERGSVLAMICASAGAIIILVLFLVMFIVQTVAVTFCGCCLLQLSPKLVMLSCLLSPSVTPDTCIPRSIILHPQGVFCDGAGVCRVTTSVFMPEVLAACQEEMAKIFVSELFFLTGWTSLK